MSDRDSSIPDVLAEVAADAEQQRHAPTVLHRSERIPEDPSQVYSIRIPASRLAQVRRHARQQGTSPSAMLRQWILDQLEPAGDSIAPPYVFQPQQPPDAAAFRSAIRIPPNMRAGH